jgi:hypothetical protein
MTKQEYERLEKSRDDAEQMGADASTIRRNTKQNQKDAKIELRKLP